ncbi:MAG: hypothetical protein AB7Q97_23200 [Gammaproteobacteria bacterium]
MNKAPNHPRRGPLSGTLLMICAAALFVAVASARAADPGPAAGADTPPAGSSAPSETDRPLIQTPGADPASKKCSWGCLRWTETCNVDPRGVYRCMRTCAQTGETCE